ncbi:hypothetical protein VYU27_004158 [Nannochloropsis oceanica]
MRTMSAATEVAEKRPRVLLEVCVDSLQGVATALRHGADRIELCSALEVGGLTPSLGLMETAASLVASQHLERGPPEVVAMIRPRSGDFSYSAMDLAVMKRDIECARRVGLAGVVFGSTTASDTDLDLTAIRSLVAVAQTPHLSHSTPFSITLHRAIDLSPDPVASLRSMLKELPPGSIDRVLTSGGARSAWDGRDTIARMVKAAVGSGVVVMAGAGVSVANVSELVKATGVTDVHASCSSIVDSISSMEEREGATNEVVGKMVAFGFIGREGVKDTDGAKIENLAKIVHAL